MSEVAERPAGPGSYSAEGAKRQPVSVAIVARNEASRIGACLDSVSWVDEVVVLDSGSEDDTRDICRARGATVLEAPWGGYSAQKMIQPQSAIIQSGTMTRRIIPVAEYYAFTLERAFSTT